MRTRTPQPARRGAALVELALSLPVLFLVVLGIVEFGRGMMVSQLVTNGAREGARLAIVKGSSNAQVTQAVTDFLVAAADVAAADVTVTITVTPAPGNPDPGNEVANAGVRDLCEVTVTVPFDTVAYTSGSFLAGKNLLGQCAMRHE